MNMKWFGNHCIDIDRIESVSIEAGGNYNSTLSIKSNLVITLQSGRGPKMIAGENDGYEEFYYWWTEIQCPKPQSGKVGPMNKVNRPSVTRLRESETMTDEEREFAKRVGDILEQGEATEPGDNERIANMFREVGLNPKEFQLSPRASVHEVLRQARYTAYDEGFAAGSLAGAAQAIEKAYKLCEERATEDDTDSDECRECARVIRAMLAV